MSVEVVIKTGVIKREELKTQTADTTVMPKNISFPTEVISQISQGKRDKVYCANKI